jgi:hypothetical protein
MINGAERMGYRFGSYFKNGVAYVGYIGKHLRTALYD